MSIRANGFSSGYVPAANGSQTEEYNPEEGINEDEVPAYKPSLAFIEENYVSCVTSDDPKPNPDSGYDNAKEDSSDSDSGCDHKFLKFFRPINVLLENSSQHR